MRMEIGIRVALDHSPSKNLHSPFQNLHGLLIGVELLLPCFFFFFNCLLAGRIVFLTWFKRFSLAVFFIISL